MIKEIVHSLLGKLFYHGTSAHSGPQEVGAIDLLELSRLSEKTGNERQKEVKVEHIPEPGLVQKIFAELLVNAKTGLKEKGKRHRWGVFDDAPEGEKTGFVVDAAFLTAGKPELSLVARFVEAGEPGGFSWSFAFSPKGVLTSIAKIIDTQNITGKKKEFAMRGEIYYPSQNERQKKEGLHMVNDLLGSLKDDRVNLTSPSRESGLFI